MHWKAQACFAAVVGLTSLFAAAGCSHQDNSAPPPPPMATATPAEPALLAEQYSEGEATVEAIDHAARTVSLRNAAGKTSKIKVPADVDLNRLKAGDTVLIGVLQSVSARVLPPGSALVGSTLAFGSTPPGQPEGRAWGQQLVVVNVITAIDLANHTVTLRGADGGTGTITVKDPQMQQRMSGLNVGDLVELTYSEAVAARVLPKA